MRSIVRLPGSISTCSDRVEQQEQDNEAAWIESYRQLWEARFDELDTVIEELKRREKVSGRKKTK